jgi:hypothetical protein
MLLQVNQSTDHDMADVPATSNPYLQKHQLYPPRIPNAPHADLGLAVVIPCHDEPHLTDTLDSLWHCRRTDGHTEVVVVINASGRDTISVHEQNKRTLADARTWIASHQDPRLSFHLIYMPDMPEKHAGVGLARKIGMDEAVARFHAIGNRQGIIASLDADCHCAPNYLTELERHFRQNPGATGCSVHFEHPLDQTRNHRHRQAMILYELFLRYYVHGLRYAGFPHAFYTIGSCMAIPVRIYEKQGGMNRRQAGEDFYFLHKIIPLGGFTELRNTTVFPSCRASGRVPFGTGQAVSAWLDSDRKTYFVYSPKIFRDLKVFFEHSDRLHEIDQVEQICSRLSPSLIEFLRSHGFSEALAEIRRHTSSLHSFRKRFFRWFNAFRVLKFIHFASAGYYPRVAVEEAAASLLAWQHLLSGNDRTAATPELLLQHFRHMDRSGMALRMEAATR